MFAVSIRSSAIKGAVVVFALAAIVGAALWPGRVALPVAAGPSYQGVSDNAKRVAFLTGFGWEVDPQPSEVVEITLPQTFDDVYTNYNSIQRRQGLDLTPYRGSRVKRWTYRVRNYPGWADGVYADLLIQGGTVVAGDVRTVAVNGFIHGFARPQAGAASVPASSADIDSDLFTRAVTS